MNKRYAIWLYLLTGLFIFRVLAQLLVGFVEISFLPTFEQWHSGTMPYAILLMFQIAIIGLMVRVTLRIARNQAIPKRQTGLILLVIGTLYFGSMLVRGALGLTLMSDSRWFTNYIPTFFHLVLASFVLLVGHYHHRFSIREGV